MSKKNENKWLQVGNFLLGIEKSATGRCLVCKAVANNWQVRWREDTMMFAMMMNLIKEGAENENVREYIHSLITVFFSVTTYPHDLVSLSKRQTMPFMEGVVKLVHDQNEYEQSVSGEAAPTPEQEEAALKEVAETEEVKEGLEKLDKE